MNRNSRSGLSTQRSALFLCFLASILLLSPASAFWGEILDAAGASDVERVKALLNDHPESINATNIYGETPLHITSKCGDKDSTELLLIRGADVNARDNSGGTPLHLAVSYRKKDVAELLLANKADVNAKDHHGRTPLHLVIGPDVWRLNSIIELLLSKGADINAEDNLGKTPLQVAYENNYKNKEKLVTFLRQHGAKTASVWRGRWFTEVNPVYQSQVLLAVAVFLAVMVFCVAWAISVRRKKRHRAKE